MIAGRRASGAPVVAALATLVLALGGCSGQAPSDPGGSSPPPVATATSPVPDEPTTTNTLPPPPQPSGPAPSTAGPLSAAALPVPSGWRTVEPPGNDEVGQAGNGTWVQALDPRYAAQGAVSVGCAEVTRDDYPDPVAALEGGYTRKGDPGVGLALEFASPTEASAFWSTYVAGVRACQGGSDGIAVTDVAEPAVAGGQGLIDRRTDQTQEPTDWTEVAVRRGTRVVLVTLGDPGHRISSTATARLLASVPG